MALTVLIAYDITDNKRRSHVAATLQQFGDRLQKSLFVCTLDRPALDPLLLSLAELIDVRDDSLMVFSQCANCWSAVTTLGQAKPQSAQPFWTVF